ncbi:MAG: response regulator [Pseudomonadota bacterium]
MNTRILIVEDEHVIANSVQAFLEDEGMEVHCRASAEQALELIGVTGCLFDVCIMDVRLPGLDGNSAIRRLHGLCPQLRFVIQTGSAGYAIPEDLRAIGIADRQLFRKPLLDMRPLASVVQMLLAQSRWRR